MKMLSLKSFIHPLVVAIFTLAQMPEAQAAPRHRPGNPRGIADPRGVLDPRGALDPRGVFDPRGPFDPRNPARYMYGLPGGYTTRMYGGARFYYCSGIYYYPYYINGQNVYTQCPMSNGMPMVPGRPY